MRIRSKIFPFVSSSVPFMALIIVVYISAQSTTAKVETERRVLLSLSEKVKDLVGAINMLDSGRIASSLTRLKEKGPPTTRPSLR